MIVGVNLTPVSLSLAGRLERSSRIFMDGEGVKKRGGEATSQITSPFQTRNVTNKKINLFERGIKGVSNGNQPDKNRTLRILLPSI